MCYIFNCILISVTMLKSCFVENRQYFINAFSFKLMCLLDRRCLTRACYLCLSNFDFRCLMIIVIDLIFTICSVVARRT